MNLRKGFLKTLKVVGGVILFVVVAAIAIIALISPILAGWFWLDGRITFEGLVVILLIMLVYLQIL